MTVIKNYIIITLSPLRKQAIFTKRVILDEISIFRNSVMLEYQLIEKGGNINKRNFFGFECFRSGLNSVCVGRKHSYVFILLFCGV